MSINQAQPCRYTYQIFARFSKTKSARLKKPSEGKNQAWIGVDIKFCAFWARSVSRKSTPLTRDIRWHTNSTLALPAPTAVGCLVASLKLSWLRGVGSFGILWSPKIIIAHINVDVRPLGRCVHNGILHLRLRVPHKGRRRIGRG